MTEGTTGEAAGRTEGTVTYTPEERIAMDLEREAFAREVVDRFARDFLAAAEDKADQERHAGLWDDLKQLRLDGLRDFIHEVADFDVATMAGLCHTHGLDMEFSLVKREGGMRFTGVGPVAIPTP